MISESDGYRLKSEGFGDSGEESGACCEISGV